VLILWVFYFLIPWPRVLGKGSAGKGSKRHHMVWSATASGGWKGQTIGFFLLILFHPNCSGLKKPDYYHLSSLEETTDPVILSYNLFSLVFIAEEIQLHGWHCSQAGRSCLVPEKAAI